MKREYREYITRYSKFDNFDNYMVGLLHNKFGQRFKSYREEWSKTMSHSFIPDFPLHLEFETVDACNLSCEICTRSYDKGNGEQLDFDLFKRIIDEASEYKLPAINFGNGGEPTLHKKIKEMVKYAKDKGVMDIMLGTNGQFLSPQETVELVKSGLSRITFSLDAESEEMYAKVREKDLKKVEKSIEAIIEYKKQNSLDIPFLRVSFCRYEKNREEAADFLNKWIDKVDYIDIQDYYTPPPKEGLSAISDIDVDPFICPQPWQRLSIYPNGDVAPCCSFYAKFLKLGNIKTSSLVDLWNSKGMKKLRDELKNKDYNIICKNCYGNRLKD